MYENTGVYAIIDRINGMVYVGQTLMNFGDRRDSHFSLLRNGKHACQEMQADFTRDGEENFSFVVLEICGNEDVDAVEDHYISYYTELGRSYNKCGGGRSGYRGAPVTEEAKRKIGAKNRVNMTGRKASEETRRKMSATRLGKKLKPLSEERKQRMSIAFSGENGALAKLTEEQVLEIRRLRREENLTYAEIGRRYGVTYQCISDICNYKRWKYTA